MSRRKQQNPKQIQNDGETPQLEVSSDDKGSSQKKITDITVPNGNGYHDGEVPNSPTPSQSHNSADDVNYLTEPSSHAPTPKDIPQKQEEHQQDPDLEQADENFPSNAGGQQQIDSSQGNNDNASYNTLHVHDRVKPHGNGDSSLLPLQNEKNNIHFASSTQQAASSSISPEVTTSLHGRHGNGLRSGESPQAAPGIFGGASSEYCGYILSRDGGLPKNTCHYCGAVKKGPADLQRHLRKHTGERPFVCNFCEKAFKAKRSLQYHQYMAHGIDTKECSIGEKLSEARRRRQGLDHDKTLHSSSSSSSTMSATDRPPTLEDSSGALDLSKSPPVDQIKAHINVSSPPPASACAPGSRRQRRSSTPELEQDRNKRQMADVLMTTSPRDQPGKEPGVLLNLKAGDESEDASGDAPVGHASKSSDSESCKSPRDKTNTADKQCDKYSNPADSEEEDQAGGWRRLTRNQARLASLRRREHEKESSGSAGAGAGAGAEAPPPLKMPKIEPHHPNQASSTSSPSEDNSTSVVHMKDETEPPESPPECSRALNSPNDEPSEKRKDDVANNNNIDEEVVDRACPYCGHNCSNPSDMKRHLLVHMETKPFVCKVCEKAFKAHANMLYHQKVVHDLDLDESQLTTPQTYSEPAVALSVSFSQQTAPINLAQKPSSLQFQDSHSRDSMEGDVSFSSSSTQQQQQQDSDQIKANLSQQQRDFSSYMEKQHLPYGGGSAHAAPSPSVITSTPGYSFSAVSSSKPPNQSTTPGINERHDNNNSSSSSLLNLTSHAVGVVSEEKSHIARPYMVEYPSVFPGIKQRINVKNETVIATRLDGINVANGEITSLYRCHMCGKMFNYLSKLQCHLSVHFERHISFYTCRLCNANFKFQLQLRRHLRTAHNMTAHNSKIYSSTEVASVTTPPSNPSSTSSSSSQRHPATDSGIYTPGHESPNSQSSNVGSGGGHLHHHHQHHHHNKGDRQEEPSPSSYDDSIAGSNPLITEHLNKADRAEDYRRGPQHHQMQQQQQPQQHHPSPLSPSNSPRMSTHSPSLDIQQSQGGEFYHQRYHGSYVCRYCNKVFPRLFSLQRHERVHTGYKPCFCKDCGRGFSETRNLRHHIVRFHGEAPPSNPVKQVRRAILSGLSRTSQRLMPVTQDMIAEAYSEEGLVPPLSFKSNSSSSEQRRLLDRQKEPSEQPNSASSTPSQNPVFSPSVSSTNPAAAQSLPNHSQQQQQQPPQQQQQQQQEAQGSNTPEPAKLANEIREKERLDEDVTVVIPTDVPTDTEESNNEAPRSIVSEGPSWHGENFSDTDSSQSNEIVSAPWKSMILQKQNVKSKRKGKLPHRLMSPGSVDATEYNTTRREDERSIGDDRRSPDVEVQSSSSTPVPNTSSAVTVASPEVSPVVSPVDISHHPPVAAVTPSGPQLFIPRNPLLPPGMVPGQLSMIPTSMAASFLAQTSGFAAISGVSGLQFPNWPQQQQEGIKYEDPNDPLGNYSRGSSLSRTHSRLNVVRSPVRREEVCKPTVLPDGRAVYRCTYCNKDFGSFSDINRHMDFHEGGVAPLVSDAAASALGSWTAKSVTTPHLNKRTRATGLASSSLGDIRPYKCKFCDYYARTNSQLKVHMMRHQGIREFHCKLCNYKGVTQSDLNRHMKSQIHMMKAQNECRICGEGFVSPKNMDKHLAMCQGPKRDESGAEKRDFTSHRGVSPGTPVQTSN